MNQSLNAAQRSIEITLVRQQIDMQVEALRAAHQSFASMRTDEARDASTWKQIKSITPRHIDLQNRCPADASAFNDTFVLHPGEASVVGEIRPMSAPTAPLYSQVVSEGGSEVSYGVWIEKSTVQSGNPQIPDAYDFRVRACWPSVGTEVPMQLETVVRLYDIS
jgi:hypothetical protein